MRMGFVVEDSNSSLSARNQILDQKKLKEWFDGLPEFARNEESEDVLTLVYFVEMLKDNDSWSEGN